MDEKGDKIRKRNFNSFFKNESGQTTNVLWLSTSVGRNT